MPVSTMLQSLPQALPENGAATAVELADAGTQAAAVQGDGGLNILQLILHASLPVQLVMALLLLASLASWVIILRKKRVLDRAEKEADRFEESFWSGIDLPKLYAAATERNRSIEGLEAIFEGGMRAAASRELDGLERNLEFLANVGSISPYVGLFGTVWGIMISFQGLASMKEATIATVAPGISEALVATAMGLFAAIPAVWAYNRYATRAERMAVRYDTFSEEFSSILQRQAHVDD